MTTINELQDTLDHALAIELAFTRWDSNQDASWKANEVGYITRMGAEASPCPFAWPGPVQAYLDMYVAAVMNTYRKTHLMLLDILIRLTFRIGGSVQTDTVTRWEQQACILINDIIASIPYHLTSNLHDYQRAILSPSSSPGIGRSVGGLLLLHPLYVLSTCSVVPPHIHTYARKCLAWIGQYMGIGQGTLMSKVTLSPSILSYNDLTLFF